MEPIGFHAGLFAETQRTDQTYRTYFRRDREKEDDDDGTETRYGLLLDAWNDVLRDQGCDDARELDDDEWERDWEEGDFYGVC